MRTLNCVCGHRYEGKDRASLIAALRAHSDDAHAEMQIPDAEVEGVIDRALQMTPWDGTPAAATSPTAVAELSPDRADDFLGFFDRDAFMDNPMWASCYCLYYNFAGSDEEWERRMGNGAEQNRREKAELIAQGRTHGLLAYVDGRPAAWCHAAPRSTLPGLDRNAEFATDDPARTGAIVCFVVAAPYRRQGLASRLLDAACDSLRAKGMAVAEAYPAKAGVSDARAYHGPLEMYLNAGFARVRETDHYIVVRKEL